MNSSYKILFSVNLLNDYYDDRLCTDFSIIPSAETILLLRNFQLLYKNVGNRLVILSKLKRDDNPAEDGKPFTPIDINAKFVFYLSLNRPDFTGFSNINLEGLRANRFYFTNLNKNKHQAFSHVTAPIDDYDANTQYLPGDFADDGTKKIFECIKATKGNLTSIPDFWVSRDDVQYVSANDLIQPVSSIMNYQATSAATSFIVNFFGLDTATNGYTKLITTQQLLFASPTKNIQLDLSIVPKGKYNIAVNADKLTVYYDDDFIYGGYFGAVGIFSHLPDGDDFSFLDANGKPAGRDFFIRFANRLATWKYITPNHRVSNITHPASKYIFTPDVAPPNANFFESDKPVPITQFPEEFHLHLPILGNSTPRAPGPDLSIPGVIAKPAPGDDFYCNIYLNY